MSTGNTAHNHEPYIGIVTKKNNGIFHVAHAQETFVCTLANDLFKRLRNSPEALIAIGDKVRVEAQNGHPAVVTEILPRRNWLSRRSAVPMLGAHASEQLIAANVDQVIPVFAAADPTPKWNLLDRYLVCAEAAGIAAVICITKLDLVENLKPEAASQLESSLESYRRIGYPVVMVSARNGEGLEEIKGVLSGRTSVLMGKSGVGKTSLLNAVQPGLGLRVNAVNAVTGKGRHTTTSLEMFCLDGGGMIVDTPGVREFGLWDVDADDLALFFPEMRALVGQCRFGLDCRHDEEPGCAIRSAVMSGQVDPRRYQSFMRLQEEV